MNKNPPFGWIAFVKLWSLRTFIFTLAFDCTKHLLINLFHNIISASNSVGFDCHSCHFICISKFWSRKDKNPFLYNSSPHPLLFLRVSFFWNADNAEHIYFFFSIDEFWRGGKRSVELYVPGQGCYDHLVYH